MYDIQFGLHTEKHLSQKNLMASQVTDSKQSWNVVISDRDAPASRKEAVCRQSRSRSDHSRASKYEKQMVVSGILTAWVRTARRFQFCTPCLAVAGLADLKLLILLLLKL